MLNALVNAQRPILTVLAFFGTYFVTLSVGRLLKRRAGVRFGTLFQLFCFALAFYAAMTVWGVRTPWRGHVGAIVVLLSTAVAIALLDRYLWDYHFETRRQVVIPKLVREFMAGIIFLVALLVVLSVGYHAEAELKGLLAGSGVAAIILAFGMQNLLSTLVAGASLQIGRPYKLGDWLKVGEHIGQVMEINWGDTRLRTNDAVSIEIPNNKIVSETIINLNYPTPFHAMRLTVSADYNVPPNQVKDVLRRAAAEAEGVAADPPPKAFLKDFGDSAILYEVKFWMTDYSQYSDVCDGIRTNVWYSFKRRNINIPFPIRTLQVDRKPKEEPSPGRTRALSVLRNEPLFQCLDDEQVNTILQQAQFSRFGRGERVIEEGADGESMFIMLNGTAQVSVSKNGSAIRVGVLRTGDCFGEMSLLTGEKRTATVRAEEDCDVLEISKPVMADLFRSSPECLEQLSELLAKRKLENEGVIKDAVRTDRQASIQREYTETFLGRLRSFFEL
jgi:small-conductance mechanosensitive channel/CRP-like cAMP-binding protein